MRWAAVVILLACLCVAVVRANRSIGASAHAARGSASAAAVDDDLAKYDRAGDRTTVASGPLRLANGFDVSASFALSGHATTGAPLVPGVTLTVTGPLDVSRTGTGEIVDFGVRYGGSSKNMLGRVARDGRTASVALPPAAFTALAGADDAAVRVGATTVALTPEVRASFRAMAARFAGR
jgi:hypothetical protein